MENIQVEVPSIVKNFSIFIAYANDDFQNLAPIFESKLKSQGIKEITLINLTRDDNLIEKLYQSIEKNNFGFLFVTKAFLKIPWKKNELEFLIDWAGESEKLNIILFNINDDELKRLYNNFLEHAQYILKNVQEFDILAHTQFLEYQILNYQASIDKDEQVPDTEIINEETFNEYAEEIQIMIFTAVPVERDAVLKHMQPLNKTSLILKCFLNADFYYIGLLGSKKVILIMTGIGSHSILLSSIPAFIKYHPKYALLCGIAFGLKPETQKIGDVLICDKIIDYEYVKIGKHEEYRGSIQECPQNLFKLFLDTSKWKYKLAQEIYSCPLYGPILSGEKVVNNFAFRNKLQEKFPAAIGGEMEGVGFYKAAQKYDVDWIIIKSICDWAEKKSDKFQKLAADVAINFIEQCLHDITE